MFNYTRISDISGHTNSMNLNVDQAEFDQWNALPRSERPAVQHAFPQLSSTEREFILTGATPAEWDEMWNGIDYSG